MILSIVTVLLVLELLFLFFCVSWEWPIPGLLSVAALLAVANWWYSWGLFALIAANPWLIIAGVVGYIALGVAWSFPKWWFFVRNVRTDYLAAKERWFKPESSDLEIFNSKNRSYWGGQSIPPRASENKNRILTWMSLWPLSFIWTMIDEPITKAFRFLFEQFKGLYQMISDSAFRDELA
jgi:hypothetical protein